MYGGKRVACRIFAGKETTWKTKLRWEVDIEMVLKLVGDSFEGELEGFCASGYEPLCSINCGEFD